MDEILTTTTAVDVSPGPSQENGRTDGADIGAPPSHIGALPESSASGPVCGRCGHQSGRGVGRCARCRCFLTGNAEARRHGLYASVIPPDLLQTHEVLRDNIVADLGGLTELSGVEAALVRRVCDLSILGDQAIAYLARAGVLDGGGKPRPAAALLLQTTDRLSRLCDQIGLKRRARPVETLAAALARLNEEPRR